MIKPFQIVWELVEFGLQALFLYVLAIILCVGLIAYVIADNRQEPDNKVQYIYEKVVIEKEKEKTTINNNNNNKECERISGCRVLQDGSIEW